MTNSKDPHTGGVARALESRACDRRKLASMAYVELGQDNGGILLNVGEGGLAVQSALALSSREFSEIRFQLPSIRGWLAARARVAWMSDSRTEAGIQFLDMKPEVREQIHQWVAAEGHARQMQQKKANLGEPQRKGLDADVRERPNQVATRYRGETSHGGEMSREPVGVGTQMGGDAARDEGAPQAAAQGFRFGDYSMFGADAGAGNAGVEPVHARRSWLSLALLAICLAALFFVLGANIGRGRLDQWLASIGAEKQSQGAPIDAESKQTSSEASAQAEAKTRREEVEKKEGEGVKPDQRSDAAPDKIGGTEGEKSASADNSGTDIARPEADSDANAKGLSPSAPSVTVPDSVASGAAAVKPAPNKGRVLGETAKGSQTIIERGGAIERPNMVRGGQAILVSPPAPGSPPFFVNLTSEAVSASQWIAISARRSVRIPSNPAQSSFGGRERLTIGKLIAHSEPFYPLEARDKRIEGSVDLRAIIGRTGEVINVTPVSGPPLLATAGATALREWRYEPTFIDGDPVETQADVTMVFRLR
jgi:hypothetical protein